jgi:predicted nuclease with TOPRIM domain
MRHRPQGGARQLPEQAAPPRPPSSLQTQLEINIFLQTRVMELEKRLNETEAEKERIRVELEEKTALLNMLLEKERQISELRDMNEVLEEYSVERTQRYVDLQSNLIVHLDDQRDYAVV